MRLKKLEILGFKSFPQRLKLEFGSGITCVVGPNGCGKTNIADAIRWVLGEQSAKALRGGSMGDVIFNGTVSRKPLGMADVTLTFSNSRPIVPLEYDEIELGRRIFRDGMSEYSLNKTACRLKDIRDIFFDTGIGSHAYSLIEQEMVDNVLSDNSGHRRLLFEEAAGIMKYKVRKREALLKLEATEGDVVRVNDILVEIEREANSLRRQIARARKFKRLEAEIRQLDVSLGVLAYLQYDGEVDRLSAELEVCLSNRTQRAASLDSQDASSEKLKVTLLEVEERVNAAAHDVAEVEERQSKANDRILVLRERKAALDSKCGELSDDLLRLAERLGLTREKAAQAAGEIRNLESSLADLETRVKEKEVEAADGEVKLFRLRSTAESREKELSETRSSETQRALKLGNWPPFRARRRSGWRRCPGKSPN
ncbi:MAG: AAA family ATPase [Candidatus Eisenbacteria bacterium]